MYKKIISNKLSNDTRIVFELDVMNSQQNILYVVIQFVFVVDINVYQVIKKLVLFVE